MILMSSVATASVQTQTFDQDWLFDNSNPSGPNNSTRIQGGDSNGFGNYIEWTGEDGITVKVSAWSETAGSRSICDTDPAAPECITGPASSSGTTEYDPYIRNAALRYYSESLGIENRDNEGGAPQHSIDNIPNYSGAGYNDYDAVLVQFSTAVTLDEVKIGWATNNGLNNNTRKADISVIAYNGASNDVSSFFSASSTWGSFLNNGWSRIGDYQDAKATLSLRGNSQTVVNLDSFKSNFWLISAYNPVFGGALTNANDGFKLAGLATSFSVTTTSSVSEPGTLAIASLGLFGLFINRRRKISK